MAYLTKHMLQIRQVGGPLLFEGVEREIIYALRMENEHAKGAFNDEGLSIGDTSWLHVERDLADFSMNYPNLLFEDYIQDEDGNHYVLYVHQGKVQEEIASIEYPSFDPKKLQEPDEL